jgi:superfamily II DNA or RNA helicase
LTAEPIAPGALVSVPGRGAERGIVVALAGNANQVTVRWRDRSETKHYPADLTSALKVGQEVTHQSRHDGAPSLGHGRVIATRTVAGATQHLVEFWREAASRWLPWERLRPVHAVDERLVSGFVQGNDAAEWLRFRNLAYALEGWVDATGGLGRLEIDPLPHQLHVVHTILSSGTLNWMIADDVGLGKTIEVGLILAALRRQRWQRFLLIVPAGLTRQWQEELAVKFGLDDFVIYGEQFRPENAAQWLGTDRVIVSVDRAKQDAHLERIAQGGQWDLAIFDEAHWLARRESGWQYARTQRYQLAERIRGLASNVLLLSGTPHQGRNDQFTALLELLRPGPTWRKRFANLHAQPELIGSLVVRNRKADVIDIQGRFIFRGKTTKRVAVTPTEQELAFDAAMRDYLRAGYAASARASGVTGKAIGFVMTIYRKLAASSLAAIRVALHRRMDRLNGLITKASTPEPSDQEERDARYVESDEEVAAEGGAATEFFLGEREALRGLLSTADALVANDSKVNAFFDEVLPAIRTRDPAAKVLLFTEYRTTQDLLVEGIRRRYGVEAVDLIRGGQPMKERREIVERFNEDLPFLVSTEAGGEGLNMQRRCHVMVNFDLPWNPMRLVQRVGRLYRYGQTERVVVFNMEVAQTLDQVILGGMYERLESVAASMAPVTGENKEGLIEDIIGQLVASLDVEAVLTEAANTGREATQEEIEHALQRARQAASQQDELLRYASGFDPEALQGMLPIGVEHLQAFAEVGFERSNIVISQRLYGGAVWVLRLPENLRAQFRFPTEIRLAFDRDLVRRAKAPLFDGEHALYRHLLEIARDVTLPGATAVVDLPGGARCYTALIRTLDDAGRPLRQEYVALWLEADGRLLINDRRWAEWLATTAIDAAPKALGIDNDGVEQLHALVDRVMRDRLRAQARPDRHYPISGTLPPR